MSTYCAIMPAYYSRATEEIGMGLGELGACRGVMVLYVRGSSEEYMGLAVASRFVRFSLFP